MNFVDKIFEGVQIPKPEKIEEHYTKDRHLKPVEEVAKRATALYLMATYSEGLIQRNCPHEESRKFIQKFITKFGAEDYFTEKERGFLDYEDPTDCEIGIYCWRWESLHFILWAFGFIEDLGLPDQPCQQFACTKVFNRNRTVEAFVKASKVRPIDDIIEVSNALEYISTVKDAKVDVGVLTEWRIASYWLLSDDIWKA